MGSHYFDVIRSCLDELARASVCPLGRRFAVDPDREEITRPREANDLLDYEYREPWKRA